MKKIEIPLIATFALLLNSFIAKCQWSELGGTNSLIANSTIFTTCTDASGNIYAAGAFKLNNVSPYYIVRKFDGTSWSVLGGDNGLFATNTINSICNDPSENIYASGNFTNSSNNKYVAKWNGITWSELGGLNALSAILSSAYSITAICSTPEGLIYVAGTEGLNTSNFGAYVARWNGSWTKIATKTSFPGTGGSISTLCYAGGYLYAAGSLINSSNYIYVAKYNSGSWGTAGSLQANAPVNSLCADKSGYVYAAGEFTNSNGKRYVARLDAASWSELGAPNGLNTNHIIYSVCADVLGNVYAAENFTNYIQGQINYSYVAKYNGSTWGELGHNDDFARDYIYTLCNDASGNVYAGGTFVNSFDNRYVAKYTNPLPSISIADKTVTEGNSGTVEMKFKVTLSAASANQVKVNYTTADSTASAGSDYTAAAGTIKFNPGQTSKTISILINGDAQKEKNEKLKLILSQPINATIADALGIGTIENDDASAFVIDDIDVNAESAIAASITVKVSPNPTKNQITVSGLKAGALNYIELTDLNRRSLLKQKVLNTNETFDVSKYANGTYVLRYFNGSGWQQVKVVKQ